MTPVRMFRDASFGDISLRHHITFCVRLTHKQIIKLCISLPTCSHQLIHTQSHIMMIWAFSRTLLASPCSLALYKGEGTSLLPSLNCAWIFIHKRNFFDNQGILILTSCHWILLLHTVEKDHVTKVLFLWYFFEGLHNKYFLLGIFLCLKNPITEDNHICVRSLLKTVL